MISAAPPTIWAPQAGSQNRFMRCPVGECLYEGTRGPGKTDALIMDWAQFTGRGFGAHWRGVIFRHTYPQLADVVAKSKRWFYQIFPGARFNAADYVWTFPGGEQLFFRHMSRPDDYWNYHGHEYPFIGWEELTNWKDRACYEAMKSCWRSSFPGMPRRYRSTANPKGIGHNWVKAYFIDPAKAESVIRDSYGERVRIHGDVHENKILLKADPDYLGRLEAIRDENTRKAWLKGDWDIVSGGALDDVWLRDRHEVKSTLFKTIPASWYVDRSFDWGSSKPFSIGWWAESDGTQATLADGTKKSWVRGTLFRIGEWYGCKKDEPNVGIKLNSGDIGKGIFERETILKERFGIRLIKAGPADTSIFDIQDGDSIYGKIMAGYKSASKNSMDIFIPANKAPGTRRQGLELLRTRLEVSMQDPMEDPGLFVFDTCRDWLRTVPVLPRDEKDPDDVDSDAEDHAYDETRYRVLTMRRLTQSISFPT